MDLLWEKLNFRISKKVGHTKECTQKPKTGNTKTNTAKISSELKLSKANNAENENAVNNSY